MQLGADHVKVLKRFLAIQNMGQASARTNVQAMLQAIANKPLASTKTLAEGLDILKNSDLRSQIHHIDCPQLRLYGRLDSLVPYQAADAVSQIFAERGACKYQSKIYDKASHAPFLSHPEALASDIGGFLQKSLKL